MSTISNITSADVPKIESSKADSSKSTSAVRQAKVNQNDADRDNDKVTLTSNETSEVPFDSAKVQKIKDALQNGSFQIDPNKIADKILESFRK